MTGARLRLILACSVFLVWMSWLGYAVIAHRTDPPDPVSRSQLAAAKLIVVADLTLGDDGLPKSEVTIVHTLSPDNGPSSGTLLVRNLASAQSPLTVNAGAGRYLLPLVPRGGAMDDPVTDRAEWDIAGWPRSPGVAARKPNEEISDKQKVRRPVIYPWTPRVQTQMRSLGYEW